MDPLNEEFKELLERSGWKQARAARELDLPQPSISRYLSGIDRPAKPTLRLFKLLMANVDPPLEKPLKSATENQAVYWRERALAAEKQLAKIRFSLKSLAKIETGISTDFDSLMEKAFEETEKPQKIVIDSSLLRQQSEVSFDRVRITKHHGKLYLAVNSASDDASKRILKKAVASEMKHGPE